ncbi:MAG: hypothetical protein ACYCZ3_07190 [Thiobacillus sp.]
MNPDYSSFVIASSAKQSRKPAVPTNSGSPPSCGTRDDGMHQRFLSDPPRKYIEPSFRRKPESSAMNWTPAFAGATEFQLYSSRINLAGIQAGHVG